MEQVCQYDFRTMPGEKETVTVSFNADDNTVVRQYTGYKEVYDAAAYQEVLSSRNYDKLFHYNRVLLDFLNDRLGE